MENPTITKILNNFDYESVHAYMLLTNWRWYNFKAHTEQVPSIEEIMSTAREVLQRSYETNECVQAGGFVAICYQTNGEKFVGLFFSIADADAIDTTENLN